MAYAVHKFSGVIIRVRNMGEGHRLLWLATDTHGLIVVKAISIRNEKSKLRFNCQLFSHVTLEAISGKEGWKLVGAESLGDSVDEHLTVVQKKSLARFCKFICLVMFEETADDTVPIRSSIITLVELFKVYDSKLVVLVSVAQLLASLGMFDLADYTSPTYIESIQHDLKQQKDLYNALKTKYYDVG